MERKRGSQCGKQISNFPTDRDNNLKLQIKKLSLTTSNFKLSVCMHGIGPANWNQCPLEKEHTAGYHSRSCEIIVH